MKTTAFVLLGFLVLFCQSCTRHTIESSHKVEVQPMEIKPIHITIDINIKVDKALDDFFGDLDENS